MKRGIFVCARSGSSRLPNKMNLDLGGKTALEYLIDRIKYSKYYDEIVLCTTNLQEDDCLVDIAKKTNVSYYRGSIEDKLDRWYMAALKFDIDYFVNVDGDDLFCESKLIDMAFKQYDEDDHDFVRCDESKLVAGIFTFGIKTRSLEKIWKMKDTTDTEASWLYFYDLDFLNSVMLKDIPKVFYRPEIRATLDYKEDLELVLQQKLDISIWTEMTVDLIIKDTEITIANTRKILFSEGIWIGNYLNSNITLSKKQHSALIKVGEYVRSLGYSAPEGLNWVIDFFIDGEDIMVIEINARYTGGLFPAEILNRIGVTNSDTGSVAFFDMVSRDKLKEYLTFIDKCLYGKSPYNFSIVPMGFSPNTIEMDGEKVNVWQVVVGDLEQFKAVKKQFLSDGEMPVSERVFVESN